jgi:predicted RNase H-like HicB family nuclease
LGLEKSLIEVEMRYPIILHTDDGKQFGVTVPDLPGCFSSGDSVDDAIDKARAAILFHAEGLISSRQPVPMPSEIVDMSDIHGGDSTALLAYADVDTESIMGPARRINITIKQANLQVIDIRAKARGMNRSEYLAYAGTHFESE